MLTSYAQNFEDVLLRRALRNVESGFYIDIGAQDPVIDSVSRGFYELGWRGIHVEATPAYAAKLRQDRPDETVIAAAVADRVGLMTFFEIPDTGISTGDAAIAASHRARGFATREITVSCVTLESIFRSCGDRDIHWMKIDVEGMERAVLASWGRHRARPWLVVVESTVPGTQTENYKSWESLLLRRGYEFAYFDGLNRFYVSDGHRELASAFAAGPNVFDGFVLSGTASASFCKRLLDENSEAERKLRAELENIRLDAESARKALKEQVEGARRELEIVRENAEQEMAVRAKTVSELQLRLAEQLRELAKAREDALRIQRDTQQQLAAAESSAAEREREQNQAFLARIEQAHADVQAALRMHVEREQAVVQELRAATARVVELEGKIALSGELARAADESHKRQIAGLRATIEAIQARNAELQRASEREGRASSERIGSLQAVLEQQQVLLDERRRSLEQAVADAALLRSNLEDRAAGYTKNLEVLRGDLAATAAEKDILKRELDAACAKLAIAAEEIAKAGLLQSRLRETVNDQAAAFEAEREGLRNSALILAKENESHRLAYNALAAKLAERARAVEVAEGERDGLQFAVREQAERFARKLEAAQRDSAAALETEGEAHALAIRNLRLQLAERDELLRVVRQEARDIAAHLETVRRDSAAALEAERQVQAIATRELQAQFADRQGALDDALSDVAAVRELLSAATAREAGAHEKLNTARNEHDLSLARVEALASELATVREHLLAVEQRADRAEQGLSESQLREASQRAAFEQQIGATLEQLHEERRKTLRLQDDLALQLQAGDEREHELVAHVQHLVAGLRRVTALQVSWPEYLLRGDVRSVTNVLFTALAGRISAGAAVFNLGGSMADGTDIVGRDPSINERVNKLLALSQPDFIAAAYKTVLGREPDSSGAQHYQARLAQGCGRIAVLADLACSGEALQRMRMPDLDGAEDLQFLDAAYRRLLGRMPDPAGKEHYGRVLRKQDGRRRMVREIACSTEAHRARIPEAEALALSEWLRRWRKRLSVANVWEKRVNILHEQLHEVYYSLSTRLTALEDLEMERGRRSARVREQLDLLVEQRASSFERLEQKLETVLSTVECRMQEQLERAAQQAPVPVHTLTLASPAASSEAAANDAPDVIRVRAASHEKGSFLKMVSEKAAAWKR